jgi:DNA-binding response OmpR family regulator
MVTDPQTHATVAITVVIVDDEPDVRAVLRDQLNIGAPDVIVLDEGASGQDAIDLVALEHPTVLILDDGMPGLGGIAALPAVKAASPETRVIMLTARSDQDRELALASGADAYLRKPAAFDLLIQTVQELGTQNT